MNRSSQSDFFLLGQCTSIHRLHNTLFVSGRTACQMPSLQHNTPYHITVCSTRIVWTTPYPWAHCLMPSSRHGLLSNPRHQLCVLTLWLNTCFTVDFYFKRLFRVQRVNSRLWVIMSWQTSSNLLVYWTQSWLFDNFMYLCTGTGFVKTSAWFSSVGWYCHVMNGSLIASLISQSLMSIWWLLPCIRSDTAIWIHVVLSSHTRIGLLTTHPKPDATCLYQTTSDEHFGYLSNICWYQASVFL